MSLLLLIISLYVYILSMKMCNIPPRIAFRICEVLFKIQEMFFSCLKVVFSFCKKCLFFSDIFFFFLQKWKNYIEEVILSWHLVEKKFRQKKFDSIFHPFIYVFLLFFSGQNRKGTKFIKGEIYCSRLKNRKIPNWKRFPLL